MLLEKKQEKNNTKIIAKKIFSYDVIESTQIKAKELAEEKVEDGTLIMTDYQTGGIGTHGRKWYSDKGKNIAFSLIIYPKCKIEELDTISIDIAKCMVETIESLYGYKLNIKTPNDIIYNNKKMGGILTQMISYGGRIKYLLIGIGFNVNGENFPEDLKEIATSMKIEFGKEFSRQEIIEEFCKIFEEYCLERHIL